MDRSIISTRSYVLYVRCKMHGDDPNFFVLLLPCFVMKSIVHTTQPTPLGDLVGLSLLFGTILMGGRTADKNLSSAKGQS